MGHPLTVVTACSRPWNLARLSESLAPGRALGPLRWIIVHDCGSGTCEHPWPEWAEVIHHADKHSVVGHAQVNAGLERFSDGWFYRLDDDNLMHPNFWRVFMDHAAMPNAKPVLIVGLSGEDGGVMPAGVRVGQVDAAQCVIWRPFLGETRYPMVYHGDGLVVEALWKKNPMGVRLHREVASYYNALPRMAGVG